VGKKKFTQSLPISMVAIDQKPFEEQIDNQLVIFFGPVFLMGEDIKGFLEIPMSLIE
jgi:hypothetical protein